MLQQTATAFKQSLVSYSFEFISKSWIYYEHVESTDDTPALVILLQPFIIRVVNGLGLLFANARHPSSFNNLEYDMSRNDNYFSFPNCLKA